MLVCHQGERILPVGSGPPQPTAPGCRSEPDPLNGLNAVNAVKATLLTGLTLLAGSPSPGGGQRSPHAATAVGSILGAWRRSRAAR